MEMCLLATYKTKCPRDSISFEQEPVEQIGYYALHEDRREKSEGSDKTEGQPGKANLLDFDFGLRPGLYFGEEHDDTVGNGTDSVQLGLVNKAILKRRLTKSAKQRGTRCMLLFVKWGVDLVLARATSGGSVMVVDDPAMLSLS